MDDIATVQCVEREPPPWPWEHRSDGLGIISGGGESGQQEAEAAGILDAVGSQGLACESLCLKDLPVAGCRFGGRLAELEDGHYDAYLTGECRGVEPCREGRDGHLESLDFPLCRGSRMPMIPSFRSQRCASFPGA